MARSTPKAPTVDLSFLLNQAAYALSAQIGAALADLGISAREYCVLWKASEAERSQIEIAELAALDKTTMVVTLDALEDAGLAERRVSATDRRARVVGVTPAGFSVLGHGHHRVAGVYDRALDGLDRNQRAAFVSALETITGGVLAEPSHTAPQRRREVKPHAPTR